MKCAFRACVERNVTEATAACLSNTWLTSRTDRQTLTQTVVLSREASRSRSDLRSVVSVPCLGLALSHNRLCSSSRQPVYHHDNGRNLITILAFMRPQMHTHFQKLRGSLALLQVCRFRHDLRQSICSAMRRSGSLFQGSLECADRCMQDAHGLPNNQITYQSSNYQVRIRAA